MESFSDTGAVNKMLYINQCNIISLLKECQTIVKNVNNVSSLRIKFSSLGSKCQLENQ